MDFFLEWLALDTAQRDGRLSEHEARRLKYAIFRQMIEPGLTPDDVLPPGAFLGQTRLSQEVLP